ncbi:MAG: hypothetical protein JWP08_2424, partial [Bryobacterales bacterium]|nr:hypothetical protein [Bryobacterales bacterium]
RYDRSAASLYYALAPGEGFIGMGTRRAGRKDFDLFERRAVCAHKCT